MVRCCIWVGHDAGIVRAAAQDILIATESPDITITAFREYQTTPIISPSDINARETLLMANRGVLWMNRFDFWRNFLKYSVTADLPERSGSTNQVAIIKPEP